MSAAFVLRSKGAIPYLDKSGQLSLSLAEVPQDQRAGVVALARQNKSAIVRELTEAADGSSIPAHVRQALHEGAYENDLTEWTPAACKTFLEHLEDEWPGFRVKGWFGCDYPSNWPDMFKLAIQSVYVQSIQGESL